MQKPHSSSTNNVNNLSYWITLKRNVKNFNNFPCSVDNSVVDGGTLICKYYEPFKRSSKCYSCDEKHKNKENMRRERYSLKRKVKCVRFWNWLNWNVHFRAHCVCAMQFELFQELRQMVMRGWKRSRASCEAVEIRWEAWDKGPRNYLKITGFSLTSKMFREFFVSTVDKSFHFCPLSKSTLRSFKKQITTRYFLIESQISP